MKYHYVGKNVCSGLLKSLPVIAKGENGVHSEIIRDLINDANLGAEILQMYRTMDKNDHGFIGKFLGNVLDLLQNNENSRLTKIEYREIIE